jgi:hypothetical protein
MAGDPNNPFNAQLAQMNGVEVSAGLKLAQISGASEDVNHYFNVSGYSANSYPEWSDVGKITVLDYTFHAGGNVATQAGSQYLGPSFGKISFSNVTYSGSTAEFIIHGFSGNSILLYRIVPGVYPTYHYNQSITSFGIVFNDSGIGTQPVTFGLDPSVYAVPVCFAAGTQIMTDQGALPVEDLVAGMTVLTAKGVGRSVKWVGWKMARPAAYRFPEQVNPIRIRAHAFGPDQPVRDLRVSPGHAIYVDGVLVPAGRLVNGATIVQETVESIRYFHIELDSHDLLLAEGLACESYLDDGNRASFANAGDLVALHGRLDPQSWEHACAPLVAAGPQLVEIQQRLHARAEALGWVRSDAPTLTVRLGDAELAPVERTDTCQRFDLPRGGAVELRSPSGVLAELMPGLTDPRRLGVAIGAVRVNGTELALDDAAFGAGFHPLEAHDAVRWRWTDGAATLALDGDAPVTLEIELLMVAPSWIAPEPMLRQVA